MGNYQADRAFTDHVHQHLALPKIYAPMGWQPCQLNAQQAREMDMFRGIDYVFTADGAKKTVQERFRESQYQRYSDFTIRYRRDGNKHVDRHASEYYKMKADFFTYGILNGPKNNLAQCTDFLKFAVVDLKKIYDCIESGAILVRDNGQPTCRIVGQRLECPIRYNADGSSSFFPIDIAHLVRLWGMEMIVVQKGFIR